MNGVYYVLGYSAPGMHATVKLYQGAKPTFFEACNLIESTCMQREDNRLYPFVQVEQKMVEALMGQVQPAAASSQRQN